MKPKSSYLICSVQRSGTHLLCDGLKSTGVAGAPDEYLMSDGNQPWERLMPGYKRQKFLDAVLEANTTPNGVFGLLIMSNYFAIVVRRLAEQPQWQGLGEREVIESFLPNLKYIWMIRKDKARQAVSWAIALKTKQWGLRRGETLRTRPNLRFDWKLINRLEAQARADDARWEAFFERHRLEPMVIYYEDLVASYAASLVRVLDYLGVALPSGFQFGEPNLQKQSTALNEQWLARYLDRNAKPAFRPTSWLERLKR